MGEVHSHPWAGGPRQYEEAGWGSHWGKPVTITSTWHFLQFLPPDCCPEYLWWWTGMYECKCRQTLSSPSCFWPLHFFTSAKPQLSPRTLCSLCYWCPFLYSMGFSGVHKMNLSPYRTCGLCHKRSWWNWQGMASSNPRNLKTGDWQEWN